MKNILLLGDSIRKGYDKSVQSTLRDIANVYFPDDNCRFASYFLRYLHEWKRLAGENTVDVLHWNAGLWDCLRLFDEDPHTPIDVYRYYIDRICIRIGKLFPDAKVIFATSTSVLQKQYIARNNFEIEAYNAAAVEIVKKYGFMVNDLYPISASLPDEAHSDAVHYYTPLGTKAFTKPVVSCILKALDIDEIPEYREVLHVDKPVGY